MVDARRLVDKTTSPLAIKKGPSVLINFASLYKADLAIYTTRDLGVRSQSMFIAAVHPI